MAEVNVQPKTAYLSAPADTVKADPTDTPGELVIECEAISPPSAKGRTVYVYIPAEQMLAVLKAARWAAGRVRNTPMGEQV